ncbi:MULTISPECIES: hypothetical protein [unclassified Plantactinospora]|uniref:hypothetical protein n=1 Tax=unclassified Plantactinospora TaxID=2631981 RepID=UPI000D16E49A|nr:MULTISPECIES: hypothetical protein [unclassified Plantactinospora]AVT32928.1 hypothetical protein C6361_29555 [Plantactinospora sp. BC1]AVT37723.1 hypothetical protein C6W10_16105 [Plantactinospora sp. BB1]
MAKHDRRRIGPLIHTVHQHPCTEDPQEIILGGNDRLEATAAFEGTYHGDRVSGSARPGDCRDGGIASADRNRPRHARRRGARVHGHREE